jgi:hypothetical protein
MNIEIVGVENGFLIRPYRPELNHYGFPPDSHVAENVENLCAIIKVIACDYLDKKLKKLPEYKEQK